MGWVRGTNREAKDPGKSSNGQEKGTELLRVGAMKGKLIAQQKC